MSYVIQNFQYFETLTTRTPRFRFFFFYNNISKIIFFFNETAFRLTLGFRNSSLLSYNLNFYKFFFSKQFKKIFKQIHFRFIGFYDNKFIRSAAFWFFKISIFNLNDLNDFQHINTFLFTKRHNPENLLNILFNQYVLTFSILNFRFFKQSYKNFFFCLMLTNLNYWIDLNNFFNFFYNFIIINRPDFKIYPFYSNYFLNVYNF